jgi:N-acetyl-S-(2-succino)cysteine monooxygenase
MNPTRHMKLGAFLLGAGHHVAAWRDGASDPRANMSFAHFANLARIAERGLFDALFIADSAALWGPRDIQVASRGMSATRLDPLVLFAALAVVTERIGLVTTASTTFYEPYHVARKFASLDQISGGRSGWNMVTSSNELEALNFNRDAHLAHADRYARAEEFADVVFGLWDSWEDDAFTRDKASGQFFDPEKIHFLDHKGRHFSVKGPLNVDRSPQGRPVVFQAGQSEPARNLAARSADVVFTVQQDIAEARELCADIRRRAVGFGRAEDAIKVMPGFMPVVGRTKQEAEDKYARLQALIPPEIGVPQLTELLAMDLSGYDIDGPVPEPPESNTMKSRQKMVMDLARREDLTIRQLYMRVGGARAHRAFCGTPAEIADNLEEWFSTGAADGFNIMGATLPGGLADFVDHVVPELQRRGLFRTAYEGATLRENLGLPRPAWRPPGSNLPR